MRPFSLFFPKTFGLRPSLSQGPLEVGSAGLSFAQERKLTLSLPLVASDGSSTAGLFLSQWFPVRPYLYPRFVDILFFGIRTAQ